MNELVSTQRLKQLVVKISGSDPAFVNVFLDEMISLILETVKLDEPVCIDGLGIFRMIKTPTSDKRIVFYPDSAMKEGINAPFLQFEPVVLDEGKYQEPKEKVVVNTSETESIETVDLEKEEIEMKNDPELPDGLNQEREQADEKRIREELSQAQEPVVVSDGNGDLSNQVEQVVDKSLAEETDKKCTEAFCPISEEMTSPRNGLKFVLILLAICILGTMAYFVFRINRSDKMPSPVEMTQPTPTTGKNLIQDTIQIQNEPASPQKDTVQVIPAPVLINSEKESPSNSPSKSQFPTKVVLKKGERLTLLALKYYGNKVFWVYIYESNKSRYPDPEQIPIGAMLVIDSPETYGIDPQNKASIALAKKNAAKILSY
ncbi:MAG: LysM peptidoglycan-binding domain-containing protein [Bacteroidales bacterium]